MVNRGPAARGGKTAQNQDHKRCCGFHALGSYRTPSCPRACPWQVNFSGCAVYFASPSRRMSSADQPDFLPGTRGWRRFAAKNRYANSSTCAYFSRSFFNSSGFAVSPRDGPRFRSAGGSMSPGFKKRLCLLNWAAKAILLRRFCES